MRRGRRGECRSGARNRNWPPIRTDQSGLGSFPPRALAALLGESRFLALLGNDKPLSNTDGKKPFNRICVIGDQERNRWRLFHFLAQVACFFRKHLW